jgi:hypothetical protein
MFTVKISIVRPFSFSVRITEGAEVHIDRMLMSQGAEVFYYRVTISAAMQAHSEYDVGFFSAGKMKNKRHQLLRQPR